MIVLYTIVTVLTAIGSSVALPTLTNINTPLENTNENAFDQKAERQIPSKVPESKDRAGNDELWKEQQLQTHQTDDLSKLPAVANTIASGVPNVRVTNAESDSAGRPTGNVSGSNSTKFAVAEDGKSENPTIIPRLSNAVRIVKIVLFRPTNDDPDPNNTTQPFLRHSRLLFGAHFNPFDYLMQSPLFFRPVDAHSDKSQTPKIVIVKSKRNAQPNITSIPPIQLLLNNMLNAFQYEPTVLKLRHFLDCLLEINLQFDRGSIARPVSNDMGHSVRNMWPQPSGNDLPTERVQNSTKKKINNKSLIQIDNTENTQNKEIGSEKPVAKTTTRTEIINGHIVQINETTYSSGDMNHKSFYHIKEIQSIPNHKNQKITNENMILMTNDNGEVEKMETNEIKPDPFKTIVITNAVTDNNQNFMKKNSELVPLEDHYQTAAATYYAPNVPYHSRPAALLNHGQTQPATLMAPMSLPEVIFGRPPPISLHDDILVNERMAAQQHASGVNLVLPPDVEIVDVRGKPQKISRP